MMKVTSSKYVILSIKTPVTKNENDQKSNENEKKTPIVFQMKFGAPLCIILLLMFFIQRLSIILT